jgi:hypothetical protein
VSSNAADGMSSYLAGEPADGADDPARHAAGDAQQDRHAPAYIYGFDSGGNPTLSEVGYHPSPSAGQAAPASSSE